MGEISTLFVHKVVDAAAAAAPGDGSRRRALLESVGVDPDAPVNPKSMIADHIYYDLCERVAREDAQGRTISLRVGAAMRCDEYGAFGLAWKSAVNLKGSFERAVRYGRVLTSVSAYELRSEDGRNFLMLHRGGERRLGLRLSNEQTIVAIVKISREVAGEDFRPEAAHFRHQPPDDMTAHEAYFGCPVIFDSDRDALEVSEKSLLAPNRLGDPSISDFFDAHLDRELAQLEDRAGLDKRIRIKISQSLSEGVPSVSQIAQSLNMSARTLQRRLSGQGYSFQTLVDESRRQLAEKLLRETDYALGEIAFLTGFSEQSAFTRAFKRWAGQTPRSYRLSPRL